MSPSDAATNNNTAATSQTATIDTDKPTVTITANRIVPNITGGSYEITVTFNERVNGFAADDITISGTATHKPTVGTPVLITSGAAAHRSYTVAMTRPNTASTEDQTIIYTIAADRVTDRAGNTNTAGTFTSTLKDAPGVTISGAPAAANAAYTATITFSESVTGFALSDISVNNGRASNLNSDNAPVYTATITPTAEGTVTVNIAAGAATGDTTEQPSTESNTASTTFDTSRPSVAISGVPPWQNNHDAFTATFTFSEPVTGFAATDITATGGTASNFNASSSTVYTASITPDNGVSSVVVAVAQNVAQDAAGNNNTAATSQTTTIDTDAPTVTITANRIVANVASGSYNITVTFSEVVTGFEAADIAITGTATNKPTVGAVGTATANADGSVSYTVPLTRTGANTADQTIIYTIAANAVSDRARNSNTRTGTATSTLQDVPGVTISGAPAAANGAYPVTITFSENVTGFEVGDITVSNGSAGSFSGTGSSYTATITPTTAGSATTVKVNAGVATGVATRELNTESNTASTRYDTAVPTVTISDVPGLQNNHNSFTARFTFSEAVTGFAASDITVTGGTASSFTASSSTVYTASITPTTGATSVTVAVAQNAAMDAAGNGNSAATSQTTTIDTTAPTVTINAPTLLANVASGSYNITVTFSEVVTGFEASDITLSGEASNKPTVGAVGTATANADGSVSYTVPLTRTGANTQDQTIIYTIAAAAVSDRAGNSNTAPATATSTLKDAPEVTITGTPTALTNAAFELTITFTEAVTGFEASDITVSNGAATLTGSGSSYTATITPTADGTVSVNIAADVATGATSGQG